MDDKNLVSQILRKLYDLVESYDKIKDAIDKETLQRIKKYSKTVTWLEEVILTQEQMVKFFREYNNDSL